MVLMGKSIVKATNSPFQKIDDKERFLGGTKVLGVSTQMVLSYIVSVLILIV